MIDHVRKNLRKIFFCGIKCEEYAAKNT